MTLLNLLLRGSIGVRDGLGLDEIEIDFTRFEAGLIAIVGANGSGKSSIMESCTPYRRLISRDGSLSQHFFLRDSVRELGFMIAGVNYKSRILIDAQTGKQEAFLYGNGIPLSDGKTSTYDEQIEKLLGTFDLFAKSIFSCQNAKSITSLTAGKRKELFIELLGLQRYELYAGHAKVKADEMEKDLQTRRGKMEQIQSELTARDALVVEIERGEGNLEALAAQVSTAQEAAEKARSRARDLELEVAENEDYKKLLDRVQKQIEELEAERRGVELGATNEMNGINAKVKAVQDEIQRKQQMLSHADVISANVGNLQALRGEEKDLASRKDQLNQIEREEAEALAIYEREAAEYKSTLAAQEHKLELTNRQRRTALDEWRRKQEDLRTKLDEARQASDLIDQVPFGEKCVEAECKLVQAAASARERIPALEADVHTLTSTPETLAVIESECESLQRALDGLRASPPVNGVDYGPKKSAVGYDPQRHNAVLQSIAELEKKRWEQLQQELEVAQAVVTEKEAMLAGYREQLQELHNRTATRITEIDAKLAEKKQDLEGVAASISDTVAGEFERATREMEQMEFEAAELQRGRLDLDKALAIKRAELDRLNALGVQLQLLESGVVELSRAIEHWRLLQRACGKDGIPALELDAAGPEVSRIANELLASTFGTRFQIAFETTRLTKEKKQVETFEIRVYGEEGEKRIEDLSGGQRVWIEKSIQEAIAIYLSEKSGREYLTSYADESDGALDPENKQHFLDMLRESFRLGRRHFTFLITQTPEIWQQVQQRVHLNPATSSIECVY